MARIAVGSKLGNYEILSLVGKGGMGEVYRARDLKLKRDVAIKSLPDEFSRDPDRIARFEREAETLASLNNPNIGAIYDLHEFEGSRYLILELIDGDTLADVIAKRGSLPVEDAVNIGIQICDALQAAHEKGVIHRDLKPANIKLTAEHKVKLLDFGLARVFEDRRNVNLSNSPTLVSASMQGVIVGTAPYMAPEQIRGQHVDRRADIFSLGCVLFEMLTGKRAFDGEDVADILGSVLKNELDWTLLPVDLPPLIRRTLQLCLMKDAKRRRSDIADVRIDLEEGISSGSPVGSHQTNAATKVAWTATAVMTTIAAILAILHFRQPAPLPSRMLRLEISTPGTAMPLDFALSPDGLSFAFVAPGDKGEQLWVRRLDSLTSNPLNGTVGARYPFWSPDNRSIGFFADATLKRIDVAGGPPINLAETTPPYGGNWLPDNTILFSGGTGNPARRLAGIRRIAVVNGLESSAATERKEGEIAHVFPTVLPDGHHFLFYVAGERDKQGIYLGSIDDNQTTRLTDAETPASYLKPDRILYMNQGALVMRKLDLERQQLVSDPETFAYPVSGFSVSAAGTIAYRSLSGDTGLRQLTWFDRSGKTVSKVGDPFAGGAFTLSPDGRRVAVDRTIRQERDVWLMDLVRGGLTRFTTNPLQDGFPVWSPDGTGIAYESKHGDVAEPFDLYWKRLDGPVEEPLLVEPKVTKWPLGWSKDGLFLLYYQGGGDRPASDLYALPVQTNPRKPIPIATSTFVERNGQFSPNGRWVAYETNESGRFEVVVQAFPTATEKLPVSTVGGGEPRWSGDGKELYFVSPDEKMMAVPIREFGSSLEIGVPTALFPMPSLRYMSAGSPARYAVSGSGQFLMGIPVKEEAPPPIILLVDWSSIDR